MEHRRMEAEAEAAWQKWRVEQVGKTRRQLIQELGLPDADEPDGSGGCVLTWEDSLHSGGLALHGNAWVGLTGVSWRSSNITQRLWANLDSDGKVTKIGRRTKQDVAPRKARDR
jgi:hypothetical protein